VEKEMHMSLGRPVVAKVVKGKPIRAYGRTLTPVARVTSIGHQEGIVRAKRVEGAAGGVVYVRPIAVIQQGDGETQVLHIEDVTGRIVGLMATVATVVALLSLVLVWLNRSAQPSWRGLRL
jgi:uncharacterized spore protein YtfJ